MNDTALDARKRRPLLDALTETEFDLLVIGGGITGAGVARDAALRGLSVALVEAEDFAAGTSNRSSKLIHGGLRYLAMGDVALVRETALERKAVHAMAPHLAEPCWMMVPARSRASLLKFMAGITVYEKLGAVEERDLHRTWNTAELAREEPVIDREAFPFACVYREYLTDDARLVLATLRAARAAGAVVASQLRAEAMLREGDRIHGIEAVCGLSGERIAIRARTLVNATGPWAEEVARLEQVDEESRLHLSKGVHIVLPAERLPLKHLVVMNTADKRSIFAIPHGDTVYLGTTDTSYHGDRRLWPEIDLEDVTYLLEPIARYCRVPPLGPEDVVAAWSGLRPLIAQPGKAAKEMSRKDEIWTGPGGMLTIAGGKLTGFRKMAEDVLDAVARETGRSLGAAPGPTPIPGGAFDGDLEALARRLPGVGNLPAGAPLRLARLYGTEAASVLELGAEPLVPGGQVMLGEVDWSVSMEAAHSLEDLIYRRTRAAWFSPQECAALLEPAARRMGALLGWSEAERARQIAAVRARIDDELSFRESAAVTSP
ncbi:MAG: glycerol-3-phosphate dehydrogenase/oxidase [Pseudomonadales bacterium]|jgi:glycerol-3-phosphate dehydrogenase|nr:glycerol-3-phosphate dehydrogenase/oxidase [Pseudomonadales bacterium]